jgi:EAL domain-containing protein (putative c-di-GMP-specific phosphodiesterase class I)/ActR/RegA family two-component response regulator
MSAPRVLIVDDDEHICFVAARALEKIAVCDSAHDVGQATRALQRQAYDLVLVDVGLPGPSGMTLLEDLRHSWPRTGAVVLSGLTELSVATEALERGALGYVVKPFRVRDLRIQVTAALAGVRRTAHSGLTSARARIVADLDAFRGDHDERVAGVVVDLECVPLLNASYGVEAIDRLCETVERRLRDFGSGVEALGRLGPATFAAAFRLQPGTVVAETARALYRALGAPAFIHGQRIPISARLGVAVESIGESADSIVNLAEGAASTARDCAQPFVVYDGDLRDTARVQQKLLADVATAIHRSQLHVAYQAQHDLQTGACVGIEALVRWRHPTEGDVPPSVFVPLAERVDLIGELGMQVVRTACCDLARLRRQPSMSALRVSVNASAAELRDPDYPGRVASALEDAALPASALRLEITESLALDDSADVDAVLGAIGELGVQLSVDDFGTGYSSFSALTRIPWAELKLDRSLTVQCEDPKGKAMLRAIVAFGTALELDVMAEGIETAEQLEALRAIGCRYGQGFLLGHPQPIAGIASQFGRVAA